MILKFVLVLVGAYCAVCLALFVLQRSLIYFPTPRAGAMGATARTFAFDGATIVVTARELSCPRAVLYFGGNAEDVSQSFATIASAFPDRAVYLQHYRGYGGSSGSPSETALVSDAVALFDAIHAQHDDIVIVGRSLGSGVAVQVASQRNPSRLVLVTPFDSLGTVAADAYPWFPVRWLLRDRFESSSYASRISAPTLVIVAEHDEIIPRSSSDALYSSFRPGTALLAIVAGADHNSISRDPAYAVFLRDGR